MDNQTVKEHIAEIHRELQYRETAPENVRFVSLKRNNHNQFIATVKGSNGDFKECKVQNVPESFKNKNHAEIKIIDESEETMLGTFIKQTIKIPAEELQLYNFDKKIANKHALKNIH